MVVVRGDFVPGDPVRDPFRLVQLKLLSNWSLTPQALSQTSSLWFELVLSSFPNLVGLIYSSSNWLKLIQTSVNSGLQV